MRNRIKKTHTPKSTVGNIWTLDEVRLFLAAEDDPIFHDLWLFMLATGARRGEALGLQWPCVVWDLGYCVVKTNVTTANGATNIEALPKGWKSRKLYIGPFIAKTLTLRHEEQTKYAGDFDVWDNREWVFDRRLFKPASSARPGEHLDPANITRRFHAATDRAKLPRLQGPHGLRHTFGKLAEANNFKLNVIGEMLGHSMSITERYTRPMESELRELALWLDTELANLLAG